MGDRGNIAIVQRDNEQVWLYSHWGGSELPERLQEGVKAGKDRWQDESYFAKIVIGYAVPADNWKEETGYGISTTMQDNEHDILVVDIPNQRVFTIKENALSDAKVPKGYTPSKEEQWSFEQYATLAEVPAI